MYTVVQILLRKAFLDHPISCPSLVNILFTACYLKLPSFLLSTKGMKFVSLCCYQCHLTNGKCLIFIYKLYRRYHQQWQQLLDDTLNSGLSSFFFFFFWLIFGFQLGQRQVLCRLALFCVSYFSGRILFLPVASLSQLSSYLWPSE
jgi:hypothetical protein